MRPTSVRFRPSSGRVGPSLARVRPNSDDVVQIRRPTSVDILPVSIIFGQVRPTSVDFDRTWPDIGRAWQDSSTFGRHGSNSGNFWRTRVFCCPIWANARRQSHVAPKILGSCQSTTYHVNTSSMQNLGSTCFVVSRMPGATISRKNKSKGSESVRPTRDMLHQFSRRSWAGSTDFGQSPGLCALRALQTLFSANSRSTAMLHCRQRQRRLSVVDLVPPNDKTSDPETPTNVDNVG